jgi:SAM-dependent methyltransferase
MDAAEWDDRYGAADRLWSTEPNVFVEDRLRDREPGVGLDLASGEGRNAIWLADRGWEMTAVDFSSVAIERGRSHRGQITFVVADVLTWNPERSYDLVLVAYLHLPLSDFEPLIRRAVTWLRPEGELFMVGHDRANIEHGAGGPQYPEVLWDVDEILPWLDGMNIRESGVVERVVEVETGLATALDALIRAQRA